MDRKRRSAGSAVLGLLAVLVLLMGVGAWNYHRNLQLENAAPRPYRGYADAQLDQLIHAYQQQVDTRRKRLGSGPARPAAGSSGQFLDERISAYQRVQAAGEAWRDRAGAVAGDEATLRELEAERDRRAQLGSGFAMHLRRLTSF